MKKCVLVLAILACTGLTFAANFGTMAAFPPDWTNYSNTFTQGATTLAIEDLYGGAFPNCIGYTAAAGQDYQLSGTVAYTNLDEYGLVARASIGSGSFYYCGYNPANQFFAVAKVTNFGATVTNIGSAGPLTGVPATLKFVLSVSTSGTSVVVSARMYNGGSVQLASLSGTDAAPLTGTCYGTYAGKTTTAAIKATYSDLQIKPVTTGWTENWSDTISNLWGFQALNGGAYTQTLLTSPDVGLRFTTSAYPAAGADRVIAFNDAAAMTDGTISGWFNVDQPAGYNDCGEAWIARGNLLTGSGYGIGFNRGWGHFRMLKLTAGVYSNLGTQVQVADANAKYFVSFTLTGSALSFKVFDAGMTLLGTQSVTDGDYTTGQTGILGFLNPNVNPGSPYYPYPTMMNASFGAMNFALVPGDFNGDSVVDATDVALLAAAISGGSTDLMYDLNCDGVVNSADMDYMNQNILSTVTGTVVLNDWAVAAEGVVVSVDLQNTSDMSVTNYTPALDASSNFTITGVVPGTYNVLVKGPTWLAKLQTGIVVSGATVIPDAFSLLNGDCNNDNIVEDTDFGILSSDWYNEPPTLVGSDLNGDGIVEDTDFGILSTNWYLEGDYLP